MEDPSPCAAAGPRRTSFRYVYIPADVSEPLQQLSLAIPDGKEVECLLDHLKDHFGCQGMSAGLKEARKKALREQLGEKAKDLDENMLNIAADMQMVENICLLPNAKDAGYVGVNMYTDDQAQAKNLPVNPRASSIADCCGRPTMVRGDAFIARIYDDDDRFDRIDFDLSEVSSDAAWVKEAKRLVARRQQQDAAAELQAMVNSAVPGNAQIRPAATRPALKAAAAPATSTAPKSEAEQAKDAGNACVKRGDWQGAIDHYTRAINSDPQLTAALSNRALANLKLGRLEEAVSDCDQVLQRDRHNVKALLRRAAAQEGLGHTDSAVADYKRVLQLETVNKEAAAALDKLQPPPAPDVDMAGAAEQ